MILINRKQETILSIAFGIYVSALIWITHICRIGDDQLAVAVPFVSFIKLFNGDRRVLMETIGNILLFIPLCFFCRRLFGFSRGKTFCIGLIASVLVETTQWSFGLGAIELDDVITNCVGTLIGLTIPKGDYRFGRAELAHAGLVFSTLTVIGIPLNLQVWG